MTKIEFDIETIKTNLTYLVSQVEKLSAPHAQEQPLPENVTLNLAAERKGGPALSTYRTRPFLQPCGGQNSFRVGGRKCWKKADVEEWLSVDDSQLETYLQKFGVKIGKGI